MQRDIKTRLIEIGMQQPREIGKILIDTTVYVYAKMPDELMIDLDYNGSPLFDVLIKYLPEQNDSPF